MSSIPELYAVYSDHLGTPRKVTNATGTLLWSWDSKDPYGHQAPNEFHTGTTFEFDLRFPGQIFDNETGLYHNGFRDYDPKRGAYVQPDPIGLAGGMNPYSYAGGDPINFSDPTGLKIQYGKDNNDVSSRAAVAYLKRNSRTARHYIEQAENDPRTVIINSTSDRNELGQYYKNEIQWNRDLFLRCLTTNQISANPELLLFHEIYHFLADTFTSRMFHKIRTATMTDYTKNNRYRDSHEMYVIEGEKIFGIPLFDGPERIVGSEIGLKTYRQSHKNSWKGRPQRIEFRGE